MTKDESSKKSKKVCGVGINDADYIVQRSEKINGKWKKVQRCHFYSIWVGMINRCYNLKFWKRNPTYNGCTVCEEWFTFSNFKAWMEKQDWEGKYLDKDLLVEGNKVYGPETCVFIDKRLNNFLTDRKAARGEYPIGVYWETSVSKFRANCRNPFTDKQEFLGYYKDPQIAHSAWRARKHELACEYADQQTDARIEEALRKRYDKENV